MGVQPCLWQVKVVRKILEQEDIITIATTGSGKSSTYWMPLLFVKHGIVVIVTPLKQLGKQFVTQYDTTVHVLIDFGNIQQRLHMAL